MSENDRILLLHIGWHKTGTTAIQNFLRSNRDCLERNWGMLYPRTGQRGDAHHPLAHSVIKSEGPEASLWPDLARELRDTPGWRVAVVSSESLHNATAAQVDAIAGAVLGDWETRILCYLRQPDELVESSFTEAVKKGAYRESWGQHAQACEQRGFPRYLERLEPWRRRFPGTCVFRPYDRRQWEGGDLIVDFLRAVGLPVEAAQGEGIAASDRGNASPGAETLSVLREISRRLEAEGPGLLSRVDFKKFLCHGMVERLGASARNQTPARFLTPEQRFAWRERQRVAFDEMGIVFTEEEGGAAVPVLSDLPDYAELPAELRCEMLMAGLLSLARATGELVEKRGGEGRKRASTMPETP